MAIILAVDIGTTSLTSFAVDVVNAKILEKVTRSNDGATTTSAEAQNGRSEWSLDRMIDQALDGLKSVCDQLSDDQLADVAGIGTTGQQHGVCVLSRQLDCLTPFINWQDRRLHDARDSEQTFLEWSRKQLGDQRWQSAGCLMQPGFSAGTLAWLTAHDQLPADGLACFSGEAFVARITQQLPVSEPTFAGGSGVFHVPSRDWDKDAIDALDLTSAMFPVVREADQIAGTLNRSYADQLGLKEGIPVAVAIGDHQASFVGSVANQSDSLLVNVGTGAQVAQYTDAHEFQLPVELRPYPIKGNLTSNVGLPGGWSFQLLKDFVADVLSHFADVDDSAIYDVLTQLAEKAPAGALGLTVDPTFSGTRSDASRRGTIANISPQSFRLPLLARGMLEGIANGLFNGFQELEGKARAKSIVAAGNGLRNNHLLAKLVSDRFGMELLFTDNVEEAAFGAALTASVAVGVYETLEEACQKAIKYRREEIRNPNLETRNKFE